MSVEQIIANKSLITGFIEPLYFEEGTDRAGLLPDDFEKVRQGYACPKCLATFAVCLVKCPLCQLVFDSTVDFEDAPTDWVDNLKEHARIQREAEGETFDRKGNLLGPDGKPVPTGRPGSIDDFLNEVKKNKDIDQPKLSELMPTRKRRK